MLSQPKLESLRWPTWASTRSLGRLLNGHGESGSSVQLKTVAWMCYC